MKAKPTRTHARAPTPSRTSVKPRTVAPRATNQAERASDTPHATSVLVERLAADRILSFGAPGIDVELRPLNVLVGTNGSGKSNFVDLIEFLSLLPRDLAPLARRAGGAEEWLWKGDRPQMGRVTCRFTVPRRGLPTLEYRAMILALSAQLEILEESLRLEEGTMLFESAAGKPAVFEFETGKRRPLPRRPAGSILSEIRDMLYHSEITAAAETLDALRFYRDWQLGPDAPIRRPQAADAPNAYLAEDASNLAVVLSRIRKSPEAKRQLVEAVRAVYAGADDVEVVPEGGALRIFIQEGKLAIPATRLSDGTLHWLCLLAVLLDPQPPPLVCIEEPEIALHPDLIQVLARLLRDASQRMQIIVTTHSESLVDKFSDTPEVVIVCEREGNATTMRRLDRKDLAVWLKRYSLGELWRKGEIGGTRW